MKQENLTRRMPGCGIEQEPAGLTEKSLSSPLPLFTPVELVLFLLRWENLLPIVLHADDSPAILLRLGHERLAQTCGMGIGPKNIRSNFSLPMTRLSSRIVQ